MELDTKDVTRHMWSLADPMPLRGLDPVHTHTQNPPRILGRVLTSLLRLKG